MLTCTLCHFATELDDAAVSLRDARCICLSCFGRETGSSRRMPKGLRRQLIAVLGEIGVA